MRKEEENEEMQYVHIGWVWWKNPCITIDWLVNESVLFTLVLNGSNYPFCSVLFTLSYHSSELLLSSLLPFLPTPVSSLDLCHHLPLLSESLLLPFTIAVHSAGYFILQPSCTAYFTSSGFLYHLLSFGPWHQGEILDSAHHWISQLCRCVIIHSVHSLSHLKLLLNFRLSLCVIPSPHLFLTVEMSLKWGEIRRPWQITLNTDRWRWSQASNY